MKPAARSQRRRGRAAWCATNRRKVALAGVVVALLLAFTVSRPPSMPGPLGRDFEAYYAAGVTVDAGRDPYSREIWLAEQRVPGVVSTHDELLPFVGPAAFLPWWSLLARLPYRVALAIWTAILAGAFLVVLVCALRLARTTLSPLVCVLAALLTVSSAPLLGDLALGQAALVSAAGVAAATAAYRARSRLVAFGSTLVAAMQPNLAIALVGRMRSRWDAGVALCAAITFAGLTFTAGGGLGGAIDYIARLGAHGSAERFVTIQHTPAAIAYAFGAVPPVAGRIGAIVAILATVVTIGVAVRERLGPTNSTLLCCAALPLAVPFFHEHDFVLELVPVLCLAVRARGRARVLSSVAAILILVDWFGLAQRHSAQGQIVCLGFAVACAFWGLTPARSRSRWDAAAFVTLGVVAALALPLAHAHPAPTWPDALPPTYRIATTGDVSAVWAEEQRVTGLDAAEPAWGLLKSLPLSGCALLGVALVADARDERRRRRRRRGQISTSSMLSNGVAALGFQPVRSLL